MSQVNLKINGGEMISLVGHSGAGKSTILKILRGIYTPNAGKILIDNNPLENLTPQSAKTFGIGMIFQEMSLIQSLSVAQNIYLGNEPLTKFGFIQIIL